MKPKLKVGDYAEVIANESNHGMRQGEIVKVASISYSKQHGNLCYVVRSKFSGEWGADESELRKASPTFDILPELSDLEQYRLSLEITKDFLNEILIDIFNKGFEAVLYTPEWIERKSVVEIELQTLTEILEQ